MTYSDCGTGRKHYRIQSTVKEIDMDFVVLKKMVVDGSLIELIHNIHCGHYELQIDGIPVFNCNAYAQAEFEFSMEAA